MLIACDFVPHHNWMSFAAWYSVMKMLPDAQVGLLCSRRPLDWQMFSWVKTCKLKMRYHPPMSKMDQAKSALAGFLPPPLLVMDPDVMMVREMDDSMMESLQKPFLDAGKVWVVNDANAVREASDVCQDVREDKMSTFASYHEGWGNFVTASWINKVSPPFQQRFGRADMTSNEVKVERLWQQLSTSFQNVSRG